MPHKPASHPPSTVWQTRALARGWHPLSRRLASEPPLLPRFTGGYESFGLSRRKNVDPPNPRWIRSCHKFEILDLTPP